MSKNNDNKLVPKLRFPEFKNEEAWSIDQVGNVFDVTRGYVLSMNLVSEMQSEITPYPVYSSQTKNNGLAGYYKDYLYEDAITWTTDGANAGDVNFRKGKFYCTNVCGVLINKDGFANPCVAALINSVSRKHVSYVGNPKLMNGVMSKIKIPFPKIKEQQKIADCLSSLDEVITTESQKLEVLKQHRKGLLQNLFPQEGETMPRLRFKEFKSKDFWIETVFSEYVTVIDGDRGANYPKTEEYSTSGYCLFLNAKNVTKSGFNFSELQFVTKEKDELLRKGKLSRFDIVLTTRGSLGQFAFYDNSVPFNHIRINSGMVILRALSEELNQKYLYSYCNSNIIQSEIKSQAFGNAVQQLTVALINNLPLKFPKNPLEQEKIADALSSVDDLINAQNQKLEALQLHKKGLLQGLFPNVNEVKE